MPSQLNRKPLTLPARRYGETVWEARGRARSVPRYDRSSDAERTQGTQLIRRLTDFGLNRRTDPRRGDLPSLGCANGL